MALKDWSTTAASNATVGSINWAENQAPSTVNDSARATMADVRTWYNTVEWRDWGHTPTRTGNTTFTIPTDVTAIYTANRPIRCTDSSTLYGYIVSSAFGAVTTVTVSLDSGNLSASLTAVALGLDGGTQHLPVAAIRNGNAALLAAANTWSAAQTVAITSASNALTVQATENGASAAGLNLMRVSATPAASDELFALRFSGKDSGGNDQEYANVTGVINTTTSSSEDAELVLNTVFSGTLAARMRVRNGVVVGAATGSYQGAGTINVSSGYYVNGVTTITASSSDTLTNKTINFANNTVTGTLAQFNNALSDENFASLSNAETLANKTITSPVINGTITGSAIADQSGMETGTSTDTIVTPARVKFSPGVAKVWCLWNTGGTTITSSYNVSSITNTGTGNETVTFSNNLASADFVAVASANADGSNNVTVNIGSKAQTTCQVRLYTQQDSLTAIDSSACNLVIFGDF